ncbi:MAG: hypothetical protein ACXW2G_04195 [Burkholderiaceae bacterium]
MKRISRRRPSRGALDILARAILRVILPAAASRAFSHWGGRSLRVCLVDTESKVYVAALVVAAFLPT